MKKGDTLIEVTLAVGIFSMVAVAITAVMSSGTAGAQTALETTLTREEIDTQAESLRFIQTAYATNRNNTENNPYSGIWDEITERAIDMKNRTEEWRQKALQYHPDDCANMYGNNDIREHAFIINPRQIGNLVNNGVNVDKVIVSYNKNNNDKKFTQAPVYPRLTYGENATEANNDTQSLSSSAADELFRAEGIYIIAVKGDASTGSDSRASSFYDFYIRTCWYGTDANQPSTISTVIRLHNPDAV